MDWVRSLQEVIDEMEARITEPLEYEQLARKMNVSVFYFQKLFSILCGVSPGEYLRNRRLTLAGSELLATDARVIDLAMKYGYDTPEGFTRAFTRFHGVTPGAARKGAGPLRSFSKLSVSISVKGGNSMKYRVEAKEAFQVIGKTQRFPKREDVQGRADIPQFWQACREDGTLDCLAQAGKQDGVLGGGIVGLCMEDSTVVKDFPYSIGAEYSGGAVPEGYRLFDLPAAKWIVFETEGCVPQAMQRLWHQVFAEFFPTSSYRPAGNFDLEVYAFDGSNGEAIHMEIWIAVTEKETVSK